MRLWRKWELHILMVLPLLCIGPSQDRIRWVQLYIQLLLYGNCANKVDLDNFIFGGCHVLILDGWCDQHMVFLEMDALTARLLYAAHAAR